eukprot:717710-Prorocentrum_minimum.AAC.2
MIRVRRNTLAPPLAGPRCRAEAGAGGPEGDSRPSGGVFHEQAHHAQPAAPLACRMLDISELVAHHSFTKHSWREKYERQEANRVAWAVYCDIAA